MQPTKRKVRQWIGLIMMGSGLLLTTGALLALVFAKPVYEATARIAVLKAPSLAPYSDAGTNALPFDPYWLQTEFEMLQAKIILYPVITNLNLRASWGRKRGTGASLSVEETYRLLKRQVEIRPFRSTSLIEIVACSEDPAEAAQIANTIADIYRNHRNGQQIQDTARSNQPVQIVDQAKPALRPHRRSSPGLVPLILFGAGLMDVLVGYFVIRPTLSPSETAAS